MRIRPEGLAHEERTMTLVTTIAKALAGYLSVDQEEVLENLGRPPKPDMGDIAFPCFRYAKVQRKSPAAIAQSFL